MSDKEEIVEVLKTAREQDRRELTECESKRVLSAWDIPITRTELARNVLEAVRAARRLKYPVVMKIASPDILHKSDARGVMTGLRSELEVRQIFNQIMANARDYKKDAVIWGVTVQEYLPQAREVIVGTLQDPSFGPTLMFGLGGVWVEVLKDVSFRLAPISAEDAREMIQEIKGFSILKGIRGEPPADIQALVDILQKVGR
ncbi:MAG: acetate--CoA ligase family protein, partial [Candidatus Hadarchaeota archaeon]|nr:acetate--CoA ligase family protein [Candidatus Hadarchaeota archaeon]